MKKGYWIILDEINLASQSVLEGLNACFDHRSQVFIAELGRTFSVDKARTKIFACQNPFAQGGGRKGLPKSFLNRFAKVYMDPLAHADLLFIATQLYPSLAPHLAHMIAFNDRIAREVSLEKQWGAAGAPWEFNLRDLFRWCDLIMAAAPAAARPGDFVYLLYAARFRTRDDKERVFDRFKEIFGYEAYRQESVALGLRFAPTHAQIGQSFLAYSERFKTRLDLKPNRYVSLILTMMLFVHISWIKYLNSASNI